MHSEAENTPWINENDPRLRGDRFAKTPREALAELYAQQAAYKTHFPNDSVATNIQKNDDGTFQIREDALPLVKAYHASIHSDRQRKLETLGIFNKAQPLARYCERFHAALYYDALAQNMSPYDAQCHADRLCCKELTAQDEVPVWRIAPSAIDQIKQFIDTEQQWYNPDRISTCNDKALGTRQVTIEKKIAYLFTQGAANTSPQEAALLFRYAEGNKGGQKHWQVHVSALDQLRTLHEANGHKRHAHHYHIEWLDNTVLQKAQKLWQQVRPTLATHHATPDLSQPQEPSPQASSDFIKINDPRGKYAVARLYEQECPRNEEDHLALRHRFHLVIEHKENGTQESYWMVHPNEMEKIHYECAKLPEIESNHQLSSTLTPYLQNQAKYYHDEFERIKDNILRICPDCPTHLPTPPIPHETPCTRISSPKEILNQHMQGNDWMEVSDERGKYVVAYLYQGDKQAGDDLSKYQLITRSDGQLAWKIHKDLVDDYLTECSTYPEDGAANHLQKLTYTNTFNKVVRENFLNMANHLKTSNARNS